MSFLGRRRGAVGVILLAAVLISGSLSGCTPSDKIPETQNENPPSVENKKAKFFLAEKPFGIVTPGMSEQGIVSALGEPDRKKDVDTPSRRGGSSRYYYYDGFTVELRPDPEGRYFLDRITCEAQGREFLRGLSVGSTRDDVLAVFPPGDEREDEATGQKWLRYETIEDYGSGILSIYFDVNDRVESFLWSVAVLGLDLG